MALLIEAAKLTLNAKINAREDFNTNLAMRDFLSTAKEEGYW
jgi:hypothetical protein